MSSLLGVLFNMIAFAVGGAVYFFEAKRRQLNLSRTTEVALTGALVGVVAAAAAQWAYAFVFHSHDAPLANGGRTILGGVLGGWLGVEISKRRLGIKESTGALWALALPAGEIFGRIGCWFHGCCFGRVCDLPWAVLQHGAMRHPTQIYLSLAALFSFVVLYLLRDRVDLFALSLLLWSVSRIIIEPLRESSIASPWLVPGICVIVAGYAGLRLYRGRQLAQVVRAVE